MATLLRLLLTAGLCIAVSGCSSLFFLPQKEMVFSPERIGLAYEDVWMPSDDGVMLHGWFLPAKGEEQAAVLF
ncbi:MAG: hypothetical protein KDD44_14470, partial [Bdellovibrionales bacterium]|nr:hypothetical protein [Bdellovibrionales bacterium]